MALQKKTTSATVRTAASEGATAPSPSAPESSSDAAEVTLDGVTPAEPPPAQGDIDLDGPGPGPRPDDGPLVPEDPEDQPTGDDAAVAPKGDYEPGIIDLNRSDNGLSAPSPIQADLTDLSDLPPKPANLPDGGDCHIIWPGERLTIKGHIGPNGALATDCRHYEAHLAAGSKTRWTFRLLYAKGVEIHDRKLAGRLTLEANQLRMPTGV